MRALGSRGLGPGTLRRLQAEHDIPPTVNRKRNARCLIPELRDRLILLDAALVPANPWDLMSQVFGYKKEWSVARIAAHCDVDVSSFNIFMAHLSSEMARFEGYATIRAFLDCLPYVSARMRANGVIK